MLVLRVSLLLLEAVMTLYRRLNWLRRGRKKMRGSSIMHVHTTSRACSDTSRCVTVGGCEGGGGGEGVEEEEEG